MKTQKQVGVFDIHYNARDEGHNSNTQAELEYALVVSVQVRNMPDLYQQILGRYRNRLEPLRSELEIPLQV